MYRQNTTLKFTRYATPLTGPSRPRFGLRAHGLPSAQGPAPACPPGTPSLTTLLYLLPQTCLEAPPGMGKAAEKLQSALGGAPYLGVHTFGEQGQQPDGRSCHGNLMFSAVVFSSRRGKMKVVSLDTGAGLPEGDHWELFEQGTNKKLIAGDGGVQYS